MDGVCTNLHVRIPADARAPASARHALTDLQPMLDTEVFESAALLVSELVTNSVRHASIGENDLIDVHMEATERGVRIEVDDPGPGFHWRGPFRDPASQGGFGILLLDELASRWGAERGAPARVWFQLDIERPSDRARQGTPRRGLVGDRRG